MTYSLAVDIGGTFTDIVLRDSRGPLFVDKTLTTHDDLLDGFFTGVRRVLEQAGLAATGVDGVVVHATTLVTNALIERKGLPTALVVTQGFKDVLTIRNEHRYDMYDPQIEFPEPLVEDALIFGFPERTLSDGSVTLAPNADSLDALAIQLQRSGACAVAICFLNSFANEDNERAVARALAERLPSLFLCHSAEVAPQIREYPRASTTVVNAYSMPISQPYLRRMSARLRQQGFTNTPLIMLSSGGVVGAETAGRNPVRMIESGPAAGALAACHYAELLDLPRLMSFDMGGTTAKACLIENHRPLITGLFEVDRRYRFKEGSGLPITVPSIDLIEIGAGGGSIAQVNDLGLLKVGPESAGSDPGPACYGRGGTRATVTDADLILGLIDADNFLGGDIRLDLAAAQTAVAALAEALSLGPLQAARGIYRVVSEAMAAAARAHATDRGVDFRGLPLFAFGGAGPLHACAVADLLQSAAVIVPPHCSVLSAFGTLVSPVQLDLVKSDLVPLAAIDWQRVQGLLDDLEADGRVVLRQAGCRDPEITVLVGADLRYVGQQNEVTVNFASDPRRTRDGDAIARAFAAAYQGLYGVNPSHVPIEIVTWRVTVRGPAITLPPPAAPPAGSGRPGGFRPVHAWQDDQRVAVHARAALGPGQSIVGPAIIEERDTTTVLPPGWMATIDQFGCIIAKKAAA